MPEMGSMAVAGMMSDTISLAMETPENTVISRSSPWVIDEAYPQKNHIVDTFISRRKR